MKFFKRLVEDEESVRMKNEESVRMKSVKRQYGTYEDIGFRMFKSVKITDKISLSIQASSAHYCSPRKTLPLDKYSEMELAIIKNDEFVTVDEVTSDENIIKNFSEYYEGMVYAYVPVELLSDLYKNLTGDETEDDEIISYIDEVISVSLKQHKRNKIYENINEALDNNDKDLFIKLTNELKGLNND